MKFFLLFIITVPIFSSGIAQATTFCTFEKLFTVKPGMDKPAVVEKLEQTAKITLLSQQSAKLKPYTTGGDSILQETLTYSIDSSECLKGRKNKILFEFADGKLYKAYLVTNYSLNELPELMANFNFLHKQIKPSWKYEKEIKLQSNTVEGEGYNFYNTKDKKAKTNMCGLQYVKLKSTRPTEEKYQLEILWANLNNTRIENAQY